MKSPRCGTCGHLGLLLVAIVFLLFGQPAGWLVMKSSYASGLFKTIVIPPDGSGPLPTVMLIVPTNVPTATRSPVTATRSLVTLLMLRL